MGCIEQRYFNSKSRLNSKAYCALQLSFMAMDQKTKSLLEKKDVVLVKPAEPTPNEVLSLSTMDSDYNLEILCQTLYVYQANNIHENGGKSSCSEKDPSLLLKQALSRALVYYYPLAGKLKRQTDDGMLQITCTGEGVPFLEAKSNELLSSFNYFDGINVVEIGKQFVFDCPTDSQYGYHPLVIQVTKFSCGGFTIGMGLSHSVCDGFGAALFFRTLTELASGKLEPTVKPVWERERLVGKPYNLQELHHHLGLVSSSPYLPAKVISHACFNVDVESIKNLKNHLTEENKKNKNQTPFENFTTLEVLGAYVWRSRYRALKQSADGNTRLCLAMGIRNLMKPSLSKGYYGNAFISANIDLLGKDLDNEPLSKVAILIKQSKKKSSTNDNIRESLDLLETMRRQKMKIETNGAALILTDWRQLKLLEEDDFGWKTCVNMIPLPWQMFGYIDLCIFMPPSRVNICNAKEGGVRVLVSLPEPAMDRFKEEMAALKVVQDYNNIV